MWISAARWVNFSSNRRRHSADDHRVHDRAAGQRVAEEIREVDERVLAHVEQTRQIRNEHELPERDDQERSVWQDHDDHQVGDAKSERREPPRSEIENLGTERLAGDGHVAPAGQDPPTAVTPMRIIETAAALL